MLKIDYDDIKGSGYSNFTAKPVDSVDTNGLKFYDSFSLKYHDLDDQHKSLLMLVLDQGYCAVYDDPDLYENEADLQLNELKRQNFLKSVNLSDVEVFIPDLGIFYRPELTKF